MRQESKSKRLVLSLGIDYHFVDYVEWCYQAGQILSRVNPQTAAWDIMTSDLCKLSGEKTFWMCEGALKDADIDIHG